MSHRRGINPNELVKIGETWKLVALPAAYGLGVMRHFGPLGIWWGLAAGLAFAATTLLGRFLARTSPRGNPEPAPGKTVLDPVKFLP